jgi:hypothetical protein
MQSVLWLGGFVWPEIVTVHSFLFSIDFTQIFIVHGALLCTELATNWFLYRLVIPICCINALLYCFITTLTVLNVRDTGVIWNSVHTTEGEAGIAQSVQCLYYGLDIEESCFHCRLGESRPTLWSAHPLLHYVSRTLPSWCKETGARIIYSAEVD